MAESVVCVAVCRGCLVVGFALVRFGLVDCWWVLRWWWVGWGWLCRVARFVCIECGVFGFAVHFVFWVWCNTSSCGRFTLLDVLCVAGFGCVVVVVDLIFGCCGFILGLWWASWFWCFAGGVLPV